MHFSISNFQLQGFPACFPVRELGSIASGSAEDLLADKTFADDIFPLLQTRWMDAVGELLPQASLDVKLVDLITIFQVQF